MYAKSLEMSHFVKFEFPVLFGCTGCTFQFAISRIFDKVLYNLNSPHFLLLIDLMFSRIYNKIWVICNFPHFFTDEQNLEIVREIQIFQILIANTTISYIFCALKILV